MIQIAISLLALAAGVHLLIQVKQAGLSSLYRNLSWLVILLSLAFMFCGVARGVMHIRHMRHCQASGQCSMGKGESSCPYMKGGHGECKMESAECCKMKKECCKEGEEKACCKEMKEGKGGCSEKMGEEKACCKDMKGGKGACSEKMGEEKAGCKDMKGGKGACSEMGGAATKPGCCMDHKGMKADSTAKK